jgi:hypothetical protein
MKQQRAIGQVDRVVVEVGIRPMNTQDARLLCGGNWM